MGVLYSPKIVTDGLVLYLDAANPKSYPGTGTVWKDLSGNSINGILINGPSYSSTNNGTITVDGIDDYVLLGPVPGTGTATQSLSWGVWVAAASASGNIMSMSSVNPQGSWNMPPISAVDQRFTGKIWNNNRITSFIYSLNVWYYLVLVWDTSTNSQFFYVNGELQGSQSGISYTSSGTNNFLFLGQSNPGADNSGMFSGKYGNFQVYNKALSPEEILQNYNATKSRYGL